MKELEEARIRLHAEIDRRADQLFFYVDFWHIYRTTGVLMAREEPRALRLFSGDKMSFDDVVNNVWPTNYCN